MASFPCMSREKLRGLDFDQYELASGLIVVVAS